MPDQYGRTTGEDWLKLAKGIGEWGRASREEDDKNQVGLGLGKLEQDPTMSRPAEIEPRNWAKAQEQHGRSQASMVLARDAADSTKRANYRNEFIAKLSEAETPEDRLRILQGLAPTDYAGAQALADVHELAGKNTELRATMLRRDMEDGARRFTNLTSTLAEAKRLHAAGDSAGAGTMLAAMSDQARTRDFWRYNPETGTMDKWHSEREGGLIPVTDSETGSPVSMSVEGLLGEAGKMSQKDFALYEANNKAATREFNAKTILSGGYLATGPKGEDLRVIPQINMEDMSRRDFWVFDSKGKAVGTYDEDGFLKSGILVDKNQKLYFGRGGSGGQGGPKGKSLLDEALAVGQKAANQAAKDGLTTPEEAREAGEAAAFEHVEKKTGRKVGSWDEVRALSGGQARPVQGQQPQPQAPARGLGLGGGGAPAAPRTSAQALFDQMHGKK